MKNLFLTTPALLFCIFFMSLSALAGEDLDHAPFFMPDATEIQGFNADQLKIYSSGLAKILKESPKLTSQTADQILRHFKSEKEWAKVSESLQTKCEKTTALKKACESLRKLRAQSIEAGALRDPNKTE